MFSKLTFLTLLAVASANPAYLRSLLTPGRQTDFVFDDVMSATAVLDEATGAVEIDLVALTGGWVGIGVVLGTCESQNGTGMYDADMIVGWVNAEGEPFLLDTHGEPDENSRPIEDLSQDVELLDWSGSETETNLRFTRWPNPEDEDDLNVGPEEPMAIIWAWGLEDPAGDLLEYAEYHDGNRGCVDPPPVTGRN